jgi:fructose-1,6-bisphosphatase/sedoheptulose 1,7-bisphosphatase-like protein
MDGSLSESAAVCPEAQAGVGDEEYIFSIDVIVAVGQRLGVVTLEGLVEVGEVEADGLDFCAGQVSGAPGDGEAAF